MPGNFSRRDGRTGRLDSPGRGAGRIAEQITDFQVAAVVAADTTLTLTETIVYDFTPTVRHGIYRDIPLFDAARHR